MWLTDGNMTQDGKYTYTYDAENRLIRVAPTSPATGDEKVESVYDYMGRRVSKIVTAWDGSIGTGGDWASAPESITRFVYDGWNVVLEVNGMVFDNLATPWDDRISRKYTWGLDLSGLSGNASVSGIHGAGGIGGLLAAEVLVGSSSTNHVYFYDGNGNVGQTLNIGNDALTARYEYDPYGNLVNIGGTPFRNGNPFRFSTKYFDKELDLHGTNDGLYYYGYRFYSARLGRWVTRDPIGEVGGRNLMGFVRNEPANVVDILGLSAPKVFPNMRSGLKSVCDRECACHCKCPSTASEPAAPQSADRAQGTQEAASCLDDCTKQCEKEVDQIITLIGKMELGRKGRCKTLNYELQPNCGMCSARLDWEIAQAGLSHFDCSHLLLAKPKGASGAHRVVGCRAKSCEVQKVNGTKRGTDEETEYELQDVLIDLTQWNTNEKGLCPEYCFEGGTYVIDGPAPAHTGNKYYPYGDTQGRTAACPHEWQFGPP